MSAQKPLPSCRADVTAPLETISTSSVLDIREDRSKTLEPATTSVEFQFDGYWSLERCLKPRLASTNGSCSKRRECMRSTDLTILIFQDPEDDSWKTIWEDYASADFV